MLHINIETSTQQAKVMGRTMEGMLSLALLLLLLLLGLKCVCSIPTTLQGPFKPKTVGLDPDLRRGSDDLPSNHPRLAKKAPGVHPEQIRLALSTYDTMYVSWVTGDAQIGPKVTPLDPSTVKSEVFYGTESGSYPFRAIGESLVYSQIYPYKGLLNYTSGIIHHVKLTGLKPKTKYFYKCGDSSLNAISDEHQFVTLPPPGPDNYLSRIAIIGDLGLTHNSSTTFDHLAQNNPNIVLLAGDMCYANNYLTTGDNVTDCYSCDFSYTPIRESYQPRWDNWGRFVEPVFSNVPLMVLGGNHDIEPQGGLVNFTSYNARFAVPYKESGSASKLFYSFNAGGVHFIMLASYAEYHKHSKQYAWLEKDLKGVNRKVTPWVMALMHGPWYSSFKAHYQELECMRQSIEDLLYEHRVDVVFSGHVHAYERSNRVYNYELNECGPVYITIGDGGNIEKVEVTHADEDCPTSIKAPEIGPTCPYVFSSGPAKGKLCWDRQPDYSALRESSFGHGILEVKNSTHALWTWFRNQDAYGTTGDEIFIVREPEKCMTTNMDH